MIKIYLIQARPEIRLLAKIIIQMKIAFFIVLITCLNVSAKVFSQQKLSLDVQNIKLQKALQIIEKRSSYRFVYSPTEGPFNKTVSIKTFEASLEEVMRTLLEGTALSFYVQENNLVTILSKNNNNQDITIRGVVKDAEGAPLPGVTVSVKGLKGMGTSTNNQGIFSLKVPDNSIIIFSAVGFETIEMPATASMTVTLKTASGSLDEVVVQAYGTTTKRKSTSAISTLDMAKVAPVPVASINDAVAGRIPGIIVTASNGAPGSKSVLSIRGGAQPLYVIDNVIRSANDFVNINPNDIETYSILKDAAATALYGVSAGDGVVLVTTKKGSQGEASINYSYNQIFSQPTLFPEKLSSYETLNEINKVFTSEGRQIPTPAADLEKYRTQEDPFRYPNTNWRKVAMKGYAPEMRHDLSVSSGNKLLTYYSSFSYYDQGTILRTEKNYNRRATYRLNTTSEFEKVHLKVSTNVDGYVETNSQPSVGYGNIYSHIQNKSASSLAYNNFGLPSNKTVDNPAVELDPKSGYSRFQDRIFNGNLNMEYSAPFLDGLKLKANGTYNMSNRIAKSWSMLAPSYADNSTTPLYSSPPSLSNTRNDSKSLTLQGYVTYNKTFGDHTVDFTGVYEQQRFSSNAFNGARVAYQILYDQIVAGPTLNQTLGGGETEGARAAYIGRLNYGYKNKYFLEGSLRRDGDYLFVPGKQWGTFYALSANYVISEEKFMESLKAKHILDYVKLRGSFGVTGNKRNVDSPDNDITPFQYVPGYGITPIAMVIDGKVVQGTSEPGSLPSTNYSWQTIKSRNIGLDLASLNNRLSLSADYFYTLTTGFVISDTRFASTLGIGLPPINFEKGGNRKEGGEFNLGWSDSINKFTYKIGVNFTYFNTHTEISRFDSEAGLKNPYTRASNVLGGTYTTGYINKGFYANNSDLLYGPRFGRGVAAGDLIYEDINGDGQLNAEDTRRIGKNVTPRVNYGTTIDLGYKGFFLSTVIQGSGARDRYIGDVIRGGSAQAKLIYGYQLDYWRPDNTDARFPRQVSDGSSENSSNNFQFSDFWLFQSKYIRLKYLQFGYDFKEGVLKRSPFQKLRLFVSGTNLLTSAKSQDFFIDPESGGGDVNNYEYPIQRTLSFGATVGF